MLEEQHFRVKELAKLWHLSAETVRALFEDEPGVLRIGRSRSRFGPIKRPYVTMSIPKHVAERVYKRLSEKAKR